jgi:D-amino-acid dehydrogenase
MEFSGYNLDIDERRVNTTFRNIRDYLEVQEPHHREPWTGMRPLTPDGLPIVDRARPFENAYLATGYSMLGMTVGPPAGKALADFIVSGQRPAVLEPFRVDRFGRSPLGRRRVEPAVPA